MGSTDLDRLRELILAEDRADQRELEQQLEALQQRLAELPKLLPDALESADQASPRLGRALSKPVAAALTTLARSDPQLFVSVLFPVIGPIIRRAIADALSGLLRNINRTLELSLSWRSWRWRLEARRSGVPFAQVVLKHTLAWRIEHLLWIESGSGLLLAHATNSDAAIADRDAIAGMLTAISDFVRDAVLARPDESLDRVEMGEFSVRLLRTPEAYLAAVARGEPSAEVLDGLRALSEQLHAGLEPQPRNYSSRAEAELDEWLVRSGQSEALRTAAGPPWKALLALLVLGLLLLAWVGQGVLAQRQAAALRVQLEAEPGIRVRSLRWEGTALAVRGWRDPLAAADAELERRLGLPSGGLRAVWSADISIEPEILARRLRQRLAPPAAVEILVEADRLQLRGTWPDAPADLETRLDGFRALLPVTTVGLHTGPLPAPAGPSPAELDALAARIEQARVPFVDGLPAEGAEQLAGQLVEWLQPLLAARPELKVEIIGSSDAVGPDIGNEALRLARARWLEAALLARGIEPARLQLRVDVEAEGLDRAARHARLALVSPDGR